MQFGQYSSSSSGREVPAHGAKKGHFGREFQRVDARMSWPCTQRVASGSQLQRDRTPRQSLCIHTLNTTATARHQSGLSDAVLSAASVQDCRHDWRGSWERAEVHGVGGHWSLMGAGGGQAGRQAESRACTHAHTHTHTHAHTQHT